MTSPQPPPESRPAPGASRMQQVTVFISEQDHWHHRPLYLAILELVRAQGGAGATVLKGLAGYSSSSRSIHTSNLVDVAANLPLVILIVDTAERVAALLPSLEEMVAPRGGLITVVDVAGHRYRHPSQTAPRGEHLKVRQIMETTVATVPPDLPVADVLPLLLNRFYKALPVVDQEGHVLGMVTDSDVLEKAGLGLRLSVLEAIRAGGAAGLEEALRALRAGGLTARDIMGTRPDAVIGPDAPVRDAARLMVAQGVKRLPVVDREGRLLGIIGRLDILKAASQTPAAPGHAPVGSLPAAARTLGDVMLPDVPVVEADTPLAAVVDTLVGSRSLRRVVVVDSQETRRVLGIITEADLVTRVAPPARPGLLALVRDLVGGGRLEPAVAQGLQGRTAREAMTSPAITAPPALPIAEGIRLMVERGVKVLPVVDGSGRLLGIVNRARLLQALLA